MFPALVYSTQSGPEHLRTQSSFCALSYFFRIDFQESVRTVLKLPVFHKFGEKCGMELLLKRGTLLLVSQTIPFRGARVLSGCSARAAGGVWPNGSLGRGLIKVVL